MSVTGLEAPPQLPGEMALLGRDDAQSDARAFDDTHWTRLATLWPSLSDECRAGIIALAEQDANWATAATQDK